MVGARFDVFARLAEGAPSVEHAETYVRAAQLRGYQQPDLTGTQVRALYSTEDGLDLLVLDSDCAALRAVAATAAAAGSVVRAQLGALAGAWAGDGGSAAADFVQRHCDSVEAVLGAVNAAAQACAELRDDLWQSVDHKVEVSMGIDDRSQAQRPAWLSAAQSVSTGTGDVETAGGIVDTQVKPFVDNDIRLDWVSGMRSATDAVSAAYSTAIDALGARQDAHFALPGDLGPADVPPTRPAAGVQPVGSPPAPWAPPPGFLDAAPGDSWSTPASLTGLSAPPFTSPPAPPAPPVPPEALPTMPAATPGLGTPPGSGAGLPELAGGVGGLPGRITDALGGLLTGSGGGPAESPGLADPQFGALGAPDDGIVDEPAGPDDADEGGLQDCLDSDPDAEVDDGSDSEQESQDPESEDPDPDAAGDVEETAGEHCAQQDGAPVLPDPAAAQDPAAPAGPISADVQPPVPKPVADPANPAPMSEPTAESTPCEIAADALPQVGR